MRTTLRHLALGLLALGAAGPSMADDITGAEAFLCTAVQTTACWLDGECQTVPPWELNVPQFIEVDLPAKRLGTTRASGENRSTPIRNLQRDGGLIFLQGVEAGRAFSFVINEATGMASVAVAREGVSVAIFGACTPLPSSR